MKLFHLLKEDLRHVAWLLALNVGIAVAFAFPLTGIADIAVESAAGFNRLRHVGFYVLVLYGLVTAILTSRLLTKDELGDVDAFWLSKPLDGVQLLASKGAVLLLVYIAIPWALIWSVANNSGIGFPWGALARHAYWMLWFAPVVVFFSAHTRGLAPMLVGVVSLAATMALGYSFFSGILGIKPAMGGFSHLVAYIIFVGSILTGIVWLFVSRRAALCRWIAGMGLLSAILIILSGKAWYLGPSDQTRANESLAQSLALDPPVLSVAVDEIRRSDHVPVRGSLRIVNAPNDLLVHRLRTQVRLDESGQPPIAAPDRSGFVSSSQLQWTLAELLRDLSEWDPESIYALRSSLVDIRAPIRDAAKEAVKDPSARWKVVADLARIEIENVVVVQFLEGQEVEFGGIRTVLRRSGTPNAYFEYWIVEYNYRDLSTAPPIRFFEDEPPGSLYRTYFVKGKAGGLWKPILSGVPIVFAEAFGLEKSVWSIQSLDALSEGANEEELELLVIDVRHLGNMRLEVGATVD